VIDATLTDRTDEVNPLRGFEPKITACPECGGAGVLFLNYETWSSVAYGPGVHYPIHPQVDEDEETWETFPPADDLIIAACLKCRCTGSRLPVALAKKLEYAYTFAFPALMALAIAKGHREGFFDGVELPRRIGMYRHMVRHALRDAKHTRERMNR
jgi:hypothetical protein